MKVFEPMLTPTSSPVPPSNASPSMLPAKAMTTRSPFSALPPSARGAKGLFCSAMCLSASSTSASVTSAVEPFELDPLEVGELDRRHDFERHRVGEVGFAVDQLLDRALLLRHA